MFEATYMNTTAFQIYKFKLKHKSSKEGNRKF